MFDDIIILQEGTLKYLIEYLYGGREWRSTDNHMISVTYESFAIHNTSEENNIIKELIINTPDTTISGSYHTSVISKHSHTQKTININNFSLYRILNSDNIGKVIILDAAKKIDTTSLKSYQVPGCYVMPMATIRNRIDMQKTPLPLSNALQDANYILINSSHLTLNSFINYGPSYIIYDADTFQVARCRAPPIPIHIKKQSVINQRPLDEIVVCNFCAGQIFGYFYSIQTGRWDSCPICLHTSSFTMNSHCKNIVIEFTPRTIDEYYKWSNDKLKYIYNCTKIYTDIRFVQIGDHEVILIETPKGNVIITNNYDDITNGAVKEYNPTDIFIFQNLLN